MLKNDPISVDVMAPTPLILIDTEIIGGPGRGIIQLARYFGAQRIRYLICNFKYVTPKSTEFEDELRRQAIPATSLSQRSLLDPMPILQFYRLAKYGRYNILQSHGYKSHFVALVVSRMTGLPWVAFAHGWTHEDRKVAIYHSLDTWMLRVADIVITVSPPLNALFTKLRGMRRQTKLIFNATDRAGLLGKYGGHALRRSLLPSEDRILVGCFGRLSFEKGQDILLRAIEIVMRRFPKVLFLFLGDGPEKSALLALASRLGVRDRVIFEPHASAMRDYYEAVDLLVVPSRSEGLPNVILEALAFGVRVVATSVGAVPEVVTHQRSGRMVEPGDATALALAIERELSELIQQGHRRDRRESLLGEEFNPEHRGKKIVEMYRGLLTERDRGKFNKES